METITISLKERFRKGISGQTLLNYCKLSESEMLICSKNNFFHISKFTGKVTPLNYHLKCCVFIKDMNLICGLSSSVPNLVFLSTRSGFPKVCEPYRLKSSLYNSIQYFSIGAQFNCLQKLLTNDFQNTSKTGSVKKRLIISGDTIEILDIVFERELFEIDPIIKINNLISLKCQIMTFRATVDIQRNHVFVPSQNGFTLLDLDGKVITKNEYMADYPFRNAACLHSNNLHKQNMDMAFHKLLTVDSNSNVVLWGDNCRPMNKFGKFDEAVRMCEFIDSEFALFVTESSNSIILLDVKTSKRVKMFSFESPIISMSIEQNNSQNILCILTENYYAEYNLVIPWHLFTRIPIYSTSIQRFPCYNSTAQVVLCSYNGILSFFSPEIGALLMELGLNTAQSKIIDYCYDRCSSLRVGNEIFTYNQSSNHQSTPVNLKSQFSKSTSMIPTIVDSQQDISERVFLLLEDGNVHLFELIQDHFIPKQTFTDYQLTSLNMTYVSNEITETASSSRIRKPIFYGFNRKGELLLLDYISFSPILRLSIKIDPPLFSKIHHQKGIIYTFFPNEIIQIALHMNESKIWAEILEKKILTSPPKYAALDDDLLLYALENNLIFLNNLATNSEEKIKVTENVTYLTVQYQTFIIVFEDKIVKIGKSFHSDSKSQDSEEKNTNSVNNNTVVSFEFPFKIMSAGFLNPNLDLLLSLDNEVMKIYSDMYYPFIPHTVSCFLDISDSKTEKDKLGMIRSSQSDILLSDQLIENSSKLIGNESKPKKAPSKTINSAQMKRMRERFQKLKMKAELSKKNQTENIILPETNEKTNTEQIKNLSKENEAKTKRDETLKNYQFQNLFKDIDGVLSSKDHKQNIACDLIESKDKEPKNEIAQLKENSITQENPIKPEPEINKPIRKKKKVRRKTNSLPEEKLNKNDNVAINETSSNDIISHSSDNEYGKIQEKSTPLEESNAEINMNIASHYEADIITSTDDNTGQTNCLVEDIINIQEFDEDKNQNDPNINADLNNNIISNNIISDDFNNDSVKVNNPMDEKVDNINEDIKDEPKELNPLDAVKPQEPFKKGFNSTNHIRFHNLNSQNNAKKFAKFNNVKSITMRCSNKSNITNKIEKRISIEKLKQKSILNNSSPDLLLVQAKFGNVKINVNQVQKENFAMASSKPLPLISITLIKKIYKRPSSEYKVIKRISQPKFLSYDIKAKSFAPDDIPNLSASIISKSTSNFQKETIHNISNTRRRLNMMAHQHKSTQPLGNIELAVKIFRPKCQKK